MAASRVRAVPMRTPSRRRITTPKRAIISRALTSQVTKTAASMAAIVSQGGGPVTCLCAPLAPGSA
jgi:hypothetical protein